MYRVVLSSKAEKQFAKLLSETQSRIWNSLNRIKIRPRAYVKRLVGVSLYSLRVGDYRLILDIREGEFVVLVVELGHRKNVYGRLQ